MPQAARCSQKKKKNVATARDRREMCQETKAITVGVEAVIPQEPGLASDSSTSRSGGFVTSPEVQGGPPSLHPSSPPCLPSSTTASCLLSLTVPQHNPKRGTGGGQRDWLDLRARVWEIWKQNQR